METESKENNQTEEESVGEKPEIFEDAVEAQDDVDLSVSKKDGLPKTADAAPAINEQFCNAGLNTIEPRSSVPNATTMDHGLESIADEKAMDGDLALKSITEKETVSNPELKVIGVEEEIVDSEAKLIADDKEKEEDKPTCDLELKANGSEGMIIDAVLEPTSKGGAAGDLRLTPISNDEEKDLALKSITRDESTCVLELKAIVSDEVIIKAPLKDKEDRDTVDLGLKPIADDKEKEDELDLESITKPICNLEVKPIAENKAVIDSELKELGPEEVIIDAPLKADADPGLKPIADDEPDELALESITELTGNLELEPIAKKEAVVYSELKTVEDTKATEEDLTLKPITTVEATYDPELKAINTQLIVDTILMLSTDVKTSTANKGNADAELKLIEEVLSSEVMIASTKEVDVPIISEVSNDACITKESMDVSALKTDAEDEPTNDLELIEIATDKATVDPKVEVISEDKEAVIETKVTSKVSDDVCNEATGDSSMKSITEVGPKLIEDLASEEIKSAEVVDEPIISETSNDAGSTKESPGDPALKTDAENEPTNDLGLKEIATNEVTVDSKVEAISDNKEAVDAQLKVEVKKEIASEVSNDASKEATDNSKMKSTTEVAAPKMYDSNVSVDIRYKDNQSASASVSNVRYYIEATVTTGFEKQASDEAAEKLGAFSVKERGRIFFTISSENIEKVFTLRSIDNVFVVVERNNNFELTEENYTSKLTDLVGQIIWAKGLDAWRVATKSEFTSEELLSLEEATDENNLRKPSFRVTCNRQGDKHKFTSMEAAKVFGGAINDHFHWKVDLENFDFNVGLNIGDHKMYVTLALTKESLHKRNLIAFGPTSLRATICYNLLKMCQIRDGDVVCDPMCGGGSIPLEGAINWPKAKFMCGDNHEMARERVMENVNALNETRRANNEPELSIEVLQWDVTKLPLKDNTVNVFVTDLPFGKRLGSTTDNRVLYPAILKEMARVVKMKGGRAVLLTKDKTSLIKSLQKNKTWFNRSTTTVNIGGLTCSVFVLSRTKVKSV